MTRYIPMEPQEIPPLVRIGFEYGNGDVFECWDALGEYSRYRESVAEREERSAQMLASLTGWDIGDIRRRMKQ